MVNKIIDIEGYGTITINPINFKDKEYSNVDLNGKPLKWIAGHNVVGHFENEEGIAIPNSQICKQFEVEGEEVLIQKFKPTSKVEMDDVEIISDNQEIYTAIERKPYKAFTDSEKLKRLVLDENKTLKFPIIIGSGFKIYNGLLTNWKGQIILCGCRGDINKVLEKYQDDVVDIEIDAIPNNMSKKKLLEAMA
jgi:hypothetical protein